MLIVEDGSIVANANSYLTVADLRNRASFEGYDFTTLGDEELTILLVKASRLIDSKSCLFSGEIENTTQRTAWPRIGAKFQNRVLIDENKIPDEILNAIAFLVNFQADGGEFFNQAQTAEEQGTYVSEEALGPLKLKNHHFPVGHAANQTALGLDVSEAIVIPELESMLEPLLKESCFTGDTHPRFPVCRV